MNLNTRLTASVIALLILLCSTASAEEYSKKMLKTIGKSMSEYNKGKIFQKSDRVVVLGPSVNFRLAAKQTEDSSWKSRHWVKFSAIAKLEGVSDELLQEITDEYSQMVAARFESSGLSIVSPDEAAQAGSWSALVANGTPSGTLNSKKNWGVAKQFAPTGQDAIYYKHMAPFGPHRKLPKELKGILYNSIAQLDFAKIGVEVTSSRSDYGHRTVIYTEGKSSIVPVMSIATDTFSVAAAPKGEHNLTIWTEQSAESLNIHSDIDFAIATEKCRNCELGFETGSFIKDTNLDVVTITVDPDKFKAAALDVLGKYLDVTVALYMR